MHRLTPREATAREQRRDQLAARRSLTGELLPPRLPDTARALADGEIGAAHVEVIAQVMRSVPDSFDPATCASVEAQVAGFARQYTPRETAALATQLVERLDPDGAAPQDPAQAPIPENTLFLGRSRRGRCKLTGEFDTAGEAAIRAVLDALAKPSPAIDGIPDERTLAARQGDALVEAAHQVLGFGELPDCGGTRPHLTVTVGLDELEQRLRGAMLDFGHGCTRKPPACSPATPPWRRWCSAVPRSPSTSAGPGAPPPGPNAAPSSHGQAAAARCPAATAPLPGAKHTTWSTGSTAAPPT